jgi:hypothetical protein
MSEVFYICNEPNKLQIATVLVHSKGSNHDMQIQFWNVVVLRIPDDGQSPES